MIKFNFDKRSLLTPNKLGTQLAAFQWDNDLIITACYVISVLEMPSSVTFWLVALKLAFKISPIRISPPTFQKFILIPLPNVLHSCGTEHIRTSTVLFSIEPIARKYILVGINVHSFALFLATHPLTIVLTLVRIHQSSNTVLMIDSELTCVNVGVRISVFSLTLSFAIYVKALIHLSVGICSSGLSSVIFGRICCLPSLREELVWLLLFLLLFRHLKLYEFII